MICKRLNEKFEILCIILVFAIVAGAATVQDFSGTTGQTPYTLSQYGGGSGASIVNNSLRMVNTGGQQNVIAFDQTDSGLYERIVAEWDLSLVPGADGLGFVLLNTDPNGASGAGPAIGEEPSVAGSFAVGFDIHCPDDYQNKGSHEISLHWDGVERANKWSSFDYRTGTFNRCRVEIDFVAGGAEITVSVGGSIIYDKYFLAGVLPYNSRVAFGARTGGDMTTLYIDNVNVAFGNPTSAPEAPISIRTFDQRLMNGHYRDVSQVFSFPSANTVYERVIMTLTVEQPTGGWDPWDVQTGIYIWDAAQQNRYEIARFMTPYSKAGTWYFDVTDYQNLLRGDRKMAMWVNSWKSDPSDAGYWITTDFDYYEGDPEWAVVGVQKLWSGTPTYGAGSDPQMTAFFADKQIAIPTGAKKTKLRFLVTGHGQSPNTDSGAEFIARGRTVTANGGSHYNMLWKDDCYLNPCRPQAGTWKYSRAGWAPGDAVTPWEIDITNEVVSGQTATLGYQADEYINTTPDWGNISRHWVESHIIYYGLSSDMPPFVDAGSDAITALQLLPAMIAGTINDNGENDIVDNDVVWSIAGYPGTPVDAAAQMIDRGGDAFLGDWIGTDARQPGDPLTLTLSGLPNGTYNWISTHHDVDNPGQTGLFDVTVNDSTGSTTTTGIDISAGSEDVTTLALTIVSDGSDITLVFDCQAAPTDDILTVFFVMNGFELTDGVDTVKVDFSRNSSRVAGGYEGYIASHEVLSTFTEQDFALGTATLSVLPGWGPLAAGYINASLTKTSTDPLNPVAELTANVTGEYTIQLTATDLAGKSNSDTMVVSIEANTCDAGIAAGASINFYDVTGPEGTPDCLVNLLDFAAFAAEWLLDQNLTGTYMY